MKDPDVSGLTLLIWQAGRRGSWNIDFTTLRPFVARVLLVDGGAGSYLLPPLRRHFPGLPVDHLVLTAGATPGDWTRQIGEELGATDQRVLALQAGTNAAAGRRFQLPDGDSPQSAIHLLPDRREAYWAPVLARNEPGKFRAAPDGEVVIDVDPVEGECNSELTVALRKRPTASSKALTRELNRLLDRFRESGTPGLLFDIAECHYKLARYPEARFWYQRGLAECGDDPSKWSARYRCALCLLAADHPWPAVEAELADAFDRDPERAEPLYYIARHYRDAGDYSKALELAAVGLQIDTPRTPDLFEFSVYQYELPLVYMSCAEKLGRERDCVRLANQVLRRPSVPEDARVEAAAARSRCMDRIQPVYPLSLRRRNRIVVVAPFRNAGEFLGPCVESIAAQDYDACRFVLIDDASTDGALDGLELRDPRFVLLRNETRRGVLRNQLDAINNYCEPEDIVVYVDGDDRLVDAAALSYVNNFFNATRCWVMYGQYRRSDGGYGVCEPIVDEEPDVLRAANAMHFPMHIRAHRAGLIGRLEYLDPELTRLRGDDGQFLDSIADMALMRALMQLAGPARIRYNDRILYEYNVRNPESHYSEFELKRRQNREADMLSAREPLPAVSSYRADGGPGRGVQDGSRRTELLFLALDGMSPELTRQWTSMGLLPNLERFLAGAASRDIEAPEGFGNDVFWISLCTGESIDELGYYYRIHWDPERYEFKHFEPGTRLDKPTFWSKLVDSGREMAVIDFPEIRRAGPINGLEVTEWITHARLLPPRFVPAALESDWISRFGSDPTGGRTDTMTPRNGAQFVEVRDQLLESVEQKTRAALHYLERGGWDFFALSYSQGHDAGHQFWHVHEPGHPRHRPNWLQRYGDPVLQTYQRMDQAVGRVIEHAGPDAGVVIVMGLAMEAKVSCNTVLDQVLWQIENAEYGSAAVAASPGRFDQRRFFPLMNNNLSGAVRVNLRGRERAGIIEPGAEYQDTLDRVERRLREVVNVDTGESIVSEFIRVQDAYAGSRVDALPDMILVWNRKSPVKRVSAPWFEPIELRHRDITDTRSGDHVSQAEMMANIEMPFPEGRTVPVHNIAAWLERVVMNGCDRAL